MDNLNIAVWRLYSCLNLQCQHTFHTPCSCFLAFSIFCHCSYVSCPCPFPVALHSPVSCYLFPYTRTCLLFQFICQLIYARLFVLFLVWMLCVPTIHSCVFCLLVSCTDPVCEPQLLLNLPCCVWISCYRTLIRFLDNDSQTVFCLSMFEPLSASTTTNLFIRIVSDCWYPNFACLYHKLSKTITCFAKVAIDSSVFMYDNLVSDWTGNSADCLRSSQHKSEILSIHQTFQSLLLRWRISSE